MTDVSHNANNINKIIVDDKGDEAIAKELQLKTIYQRPIFS